MVGHIKLLGKAKAAQPALERGLLLVYVILVLDQVGVLGEGDAAVAAEGLVARVRSEVVVELAWAINHFMTIIIVFALENPHVILAIPLPEELVHDKL